MLGDMLELGSYSETAHRNVGEYAAECAIDMLFTFGNESKYMADSAEKAGLKNTFNFTEKQGLIDELSRTLQDGDTVLFKASRGMKLEEVFEELYKLWEV